MTYWLLGTVVCTTLFILSRSNNVNIFEEEPNCFTRSPNLSKIGAITIANEPPVKENNGLKTIDENYVNADTNADVDDTDTTDISKTGAVLLLDEIVTKAASAASNSRKLQNDFNSIKF